MYTYIHIRYGSNYTKRFPTQCCCGNCGYLIYLHVNTYFSKMLHKFLKFAFPMDMCMNPWMFSCVISVNDTLGCDCNLHSNSCVFSNQLYLMSMKVSGGVCQDCQHNTVGRRCHNCVTGYYRDWTKPVSHDQVCLGKSFASR